MADHLRRPGRRSRLQLHRAGGAGPGSGPRAGRPHRRQPGGTLPAAHGTDDQKQRWLPGILKAERLVCQLFSEPDAGSDLASLRTRAEPAGGGWLLHGRKVWTSYAQFADWGLCLARTDPAAGKRAGITALMVDMRADGMEVRPLRQITAESDFTRSLRRGVRGRLPGDRTGQRRLGRGRVGLAGERGTNPRQLVIHSQLLESWCAWPASRGLADDPRTAQDLAQAFVEVRLFQLPELASAVQAGPRPPARR